MCDVTAESFSYFEIAKANTADRQISDSTQIVCIELSWNFANLWNVLELQNDILNLFYNILNMHYYYNELINGIFNK